MAKVSNTNFFKVNSHSTVVDANSVASNSAAVSPDRQSKKSPILELGYLISELSNAAKSLHEAGLDGPSKQLTQVSNDVAKNRFVLAVVGEFNRGKSTFINKLLGRAVVPVGNLPTTAVLTRVCCSVGHNQERILHLDNSNKIVSERREISKEAWHGLTVDNKGNNDPCGSIVVNVNNSWLAENNLEILDAPGAGDLKGGRAKQTEEAITKSDGVIIAIDSRQALSMTEKLFMEQHIASRKIPFLMIILTRMDNVDPDERLETLEYIESRLKSWNMGDIPIYISRDVEIPESDKYDSHKGIEAIKAAIESWICDPGRKELTEVWIKSRVLSILSRTEEAIKEQIVAYEIKDESEREAFINTKKQALQKIEDKFRELCYQFEDRKRKCYQAFQDLLSECQERIIKALQLRAMQVGSPKKWWDKEYELERGGHLVQANKALREKISVIFHRDADWFDVTLEKNLKIKSSVAELEANISGYSKTLSSSSKVPYELDNTIDNISNMTKAAKVALGLGAFAIAVGSGFGAVSLLCMGVSTAATMWADKAAGEKLDEQREELKKVIETDIPQAIRQAACASEDRINEFYDEIIRGAQENKRLWMEAQNEAIQTSYQPQTEELRKKLSVQISCLESLKVKFA